MGTENAITPLNLDSATSLPTGQLSDVHLLGAISPSVTTSTSEQNAYAKEIVIRGTDQLSLTIQIDVARESVMQKHLVANRGPLKVNTSPWLEG